MALAKGTKFGPYEIVGPLGAGGMGEVYRARDPRLGRDVALKILPAEFSTDEMRRARFEQEARAAAALNHPNIVGVYDIGAEGGVMYIVTELVTGETLGALIERGPVPAKKLLDLAAQVADGMAAAHAARITHRDLKPANIMIDATGRAKILDFGLAKRAAQTTSADQTATIHQTSPGMIVGTAYYMSPEQARGRDVDYRSDQFSFGLILYEMAAGKKAFDKPESVQILSAILSEDPPPLDKKTPAPLRWIIDRCLAKEPGDRYESTRDLYSNLRALRDNLTEAVSTTELAAVAAPVKRKPSWQAAAIAFAAGLVAAVALILALRKPPPPDQSNFKFTPFSFESGGQCCYSFSPDGGAVAYSVIRDGKPYQVFMRRLDAPAPVQMTHLADDATATGWSADGKHILFQRPGLKPFGIWSISMVGGEPEFLFAIEHEHYAWTLSGDVKTYAALHEGSDGKYGVWYASPPGSTLKKYEPDPFATREVYNTPQMAFSPDGKQLLMYIAGAQRRDEAWLMPFPPDPSHPPKKVFTSLNGFNGTPEFTWAPDNRHVVLAAAPTGRDGQLWLADTQSEQRQALIVGTHNFSSPEMSPDGEHLLFWENGNRSQVVSVDLSNAAVTPLIATDRWQIMPAWAAKAPVMAYVTDRNGPSEIWLRGPGDSDRPLVRSADSASTQRWLMGPTPSPDGTRVAYVVADSKGGAINLWMISSGGGAAVRMTNETNASEFAGSWSPDGVWFVYLRLANGKVDLMKVKTSGEAAPVVMKADIDPNNSAVPCWSPTDEWIGYSDKGDKLISPDGSRQKDLGDRQSSASAFSADGKTLFGMRKEDLIATTIATGAERVIGNVGKDNGPRSNQGPAIRMSLAPDGKSVTYGTTRYKNNVWMFEGFTPKMGMLERLGIR
jgi:serine/threonine protein kinase/Tol biopolymer transport system component